MYRYLFLPLCVLLYFSCQKKVQRSFLLNHPTSYDAAIPRAYDDGDPCKVTDNYMPDPLHPEHTPIKYIRINFHIVNSLDSTANFDEKSGAIFCKQVLDCANNKLTRNKQMHLPLGNDTEVLPIRYQYKLTPDPNIPGDDGIYFHYDDEHYYTMNNGPKKNNFSKGAFEKYGTRKDTVMNVFLLDFPTDSADLANYKLNSNGVAFGSWVKIIGWQHDVKDTVWLDNGKFKLHKGKWYAQKNLNHEIGHNLGLNHSWITNDGCDDTPKHANCFSNTPTGPCKDKWSNNFMDYNIHSSAWSPCQIAKAHKNMMGMGKRKKLRGMLEPTWCILKEEQKIVIGSRVEWNGAKDMESHIVVRNGGSLTIRCKVSLPKGAKIIVYPGGKLTLDGAYLYNDCGEKWEGIEIVKRGKQGGNVVYGANGAEILDVVNGDFDKKP